jgi:hypothetical protein
MTALIGLVVLVIVLALAKGFVKLDPKGVVKGMRVAGGLAAIGAGVVLTVRGAAAIGVPLGITGLGLLGWLPFGPASFGQRTEKSTGQVSQVRTSFLEMQLDHDSGALAGHVLAGRYAGTPLEALDTPTLVGLLGEIDEESRALLGAYLDRRSPGWRDDPDAGPSARERGTVGTGKMTDQEAYQILGLQPGATPAEIGRAHRTLMKKLHPDQGGSTYLAARVNEAKEVLLRRHG